MGLLPYLAMTAAEMGSCRELPPRFAYMACHFSPYSTGLSNIPEQLPKGAMLIVNDRTPICGHDPELIARQLRQAAEQLECMGVLLDFQRPDYPQARLVAACAAKALHCPVAVSPWCGQDLDCPVFLPPPPLRQPLDAYLAPWKDREIWLEAALEAETVTVTPDGCTAGPLQGDIAQPFFEEESLCCRYRAEVQPDQIRFYVQRTPALLDALLAKAEALGVTHAVGLYQQLCPQAEAADTGEC